MTPTTDYLLLPVLSFAILVTHTECTVVATAVADAAIPITDDVINSSSPSDVRSFPPLLKKPTQLDLIYNADFAETWMTRLQDYLRDKRLGDIVIPGTHRSASYLHRPVAELSSAEWGLHGVAPPRNSFRGISRRHDPVELRPWFSGQRRRWRRGASSTARMPYHDGNLVRQLEAGFRYLDLKVFTNDLDTSFSNDDDEDEPLLGGRLEDDLRDVTSFAEQHPLEVIILSFDISVHTSKTTPRASRTLKDIAANLGDIICRILDHKTARNLENNPKMSHIWNASNRNIILSFKEPLSKTTVKCSSFTLPLVSFSKEFKDVEMMFGELQEALSTHHKLYQGNVTTITLSLLPQTISHFIDMFELLRSVLAPIFITIMLTSFILACRLLHSKVKCPRRPKCRRRCLTLLVLFCLVVSYVILKLYSVLTSEDIAKSLLLMRSYNTGSKLAASHSLTLAPFQCHSLNDMLRYWLARPTKYKSNVFLVNDYRSSDLVAMAIHANLGKLRPSMSLMHAGSPITGAPGITGLFSCPAIFVVYIVVSRDEEKVVLSSVLSEGQHVTFQAQQFPMDSSLIVMVGGTSGRWYHLYTGNIHFCIEHSVDFYIRGTQLKSGMGHAYISTEHQTFASSCKAKFVMPHILNWTSWKVVA